MSAAKKKPSRKAAKTSAKAKPKTKAKVKAKAKAKANSTAKKAAPKAAPKAAAKSAAKPKTQTAAPALKPQTVSPAQSLHAQRKAILEGKAVAALKTMLHTNDQVTTGNKDELVERVLDRIENGNMPRCTQCGLGRLRLNDKGDFWCPGGYDDDEFVECSFTATAGSLERPAWQFETAGSLV